MWRAMYLVGQALATASPRTGDPQLEKLLIFLFQNVPLRISFSKENSF